MKRPTTACSAVDRGPKTRDRGPRVIHRGPRYVYQVDERREEIYVESQFNHDYLEPDAFSGYTLE